MENKTHKILLLLTRGDIGGVQVFVFNLARELKARGHEVVIGYGSSGYIEDRAGELGLASVKFKSLKRTNNPLANLRFVFELKKYLPGRNFDIVHLNSSNTLMAAWAIKKPVRSVFTVHGLSVLDPNYGRHPALKLIYRLYFRLFLPLPGRVVFVSRADHDFAADRSLVKKAEVVHNGLALSSDDFLPQNEALRVLGARTGADLEGKLLVGSIGRLSYQKNYEFLIRAWPGVARDNPDARLVIIGEGEDRPKYEKLIAKMDMNDKVILAGGINNASALLSAFKLFVLASRYEGLSITLIEALFAGLPILASRVGGTPELLNNSDKQLFTLDDEREFREKLNGLISDPALCQTLSAQNLAQSQNYQLSTMVEKYLKIYNK